jgi:hypothetical protein
VDSEAASADFRQAAAALIDTAATTSAQGMNAWLSSVAEVPVEELDWQAVVGSIRSGTPTDEVLQRSIKRARVAFLTGATLEQALAIGRNSAATAAATNVAYAARAVAPVFGVANGVAGWRRRPSPGACQFCLLASTQRYRTGALMPMHPNCNCIPVPIFGDRDPGRVVDKAGLALLKKAKADGTKVVVNEHGELGPLLSNAADNFTGPADLRPSRDTEVPTDE